ncbi:GNAT family N-acetyltransferase [Kribbella sp. NPDC048915]|uniref:GNAT family N-acetyltransferase n=1 Tax=Kribbella sp. NPDC048915 TaxID=3155148 RepID=UPI0033CBCB7D
MLHTIILSNVRDRAEGTAEPEDEQSYFVSVHEPDVVGVAMRTPGRGVYLGALREDLAEPIAEAYADLLPDLSGVAGDRPAAVRFGQRWAELRGVTASETRGTRLHKLIELTVLEADRGQARPMCEGDVDVVAAWSDAFADEALDAIAADSRDWAERRLRDGMLWIWAADGVPVSMVGHRPELFGVCRVGPVYTPPEHRRHGYAGALTSRVTERILAAGNQACLYTDLANPTSNKIYHDAGYRPVADFVDIEFS